MSLRHPVTCHMVILRSVTLMCRVTQLNNWLICSWQFYSSWRVILRSVTLMCRVTQLNIWLHHDSTQNINEKCHAEEWVTNKIHMRDVTCDMVLLRSVTLIWRLTQLKTWLGLGTMTFLKISMHQTQKWVTTQIHMRHATCQICMSGVIQSNASRLKYGGGK